MTFTDFNLSESTFTISLITKIFNATEESKNYVIPLQ